MFNVVSNAEVDEHLEYPKRLICDSVRARNGFSHYTIEIKYTHLELYTPPKCNSDFSSE